MTGMEVTYPAAFLAGLLSFVSPCILPLVPPYLCYLGGVSVAQLEDSAAIDAAASIAALSSSWATLTPPR